MARLHRCLTKGTTAEGTVIRRSFSWVVSRRGFLRVYSDRLECGDWTIPYDAIEEAVLFSFRQYFVIPGYLLRIKTRGRIYQFGLNWGRFWNEELPFPVTREETRVGWSPYSIVVRVAVFGYLLWYLATHIGGE